VTRPAAAGLCAALLVLPGPATGRIPLLQSEHAKSVRELAVDLGATDPVARAKAACALRDFGDEAADAIAPLTRLLADGSPVEGSVCARRWSRGGSEDLTSPGELAASALAAIGSRAFTPVLSALTHDAWIARRNAAWTLGALDDARAVPALVGALRDREAQVRSQAAWALGAIDEREAVPSLIAALADHDVKVRRQTAWALGAIDDSRAVDPLVNVLADQSADVREQAAWALGAIGDSRATGGLVAALKDASAGVRRQAAWALGVIGDK
jgi:HEAT repeat protein